MTKRLYVGIEKRTSHTARVKIEAITSYQKNKLLKLPRTSLFLTFIYTKQLTTVLSINENEAK